MIIRFCQYKLVSSHRTCNLRDPEALRVGEILGLSVSPGTARGSDGDSSRSREVFYDRCRDLRNFLIDTFVAKSSNAGQTWKNHRVTDKDFAAIHDQDVLINTFYMGDYLGISADRLRQRDGVIVSWGDNSRGDANVAFARANGEEDEE
jgi:hypothetical protein